MRKIDEYLLRLSTPAYKVSLIERDEKHFYTIDDGQELPGTTGILEVINKPFLVPWAKKIACEVIRAELHEKMGGEAAARISITSEWIEEVIKKAKAKPKKIKEDAADVGTRAHAWIDAHIKGKPLPERTEDIKLACDNFLRFWEKEGLQFLAGDTKVASRRHGVGGSLDWLALDRNGDLVLGDNKTSNVMSSSFGAQLGGYNIQLLETFGIRAAKGLIIRTGKTDLQYEVGRVSDMEAAEQAFLAAKTLQQTLADKNFLVKETEGEQGTGKGSDRKRGGKGVLRQVSGA